MRKNEAMSFGSTKFFLSPSSPLSPSLSPSLFSFPLSFPLSFPPSLSPSLSPSLFSFSYPTTSFSPLPSTPHSSFLFHSLSPLPSTEKRMLPNGRVYFVNHKSKTTQWEDPRLSMAEQLPLPVGFEIRYTEQGVKYFVDHNTRSTTFQGQQNHELFSLTLTLFPSLKLVITCWLIQCELLEIPKVRSHFSQSIPSSLPLFDSDPRKPGEGGQGPVGHYGVPVQYERSFRWKVAHFRTLCAVSPPIIVINT